jgi:iron(III) transport system ATP-binding protein
LYAHPSDPDIARVLGEANFIDGTAFGRAAKTPLGVLELDRVPEVGGNAADGSPLLVLVRPEQIFLSDDLKASPCSARVVETEFYGHDAVVRLRAGDAGDEVVVRTADAGDLPAVGSLVALEIRGPVAAWKRSS